MAKLGVFATVGLAFSDAVRAARVMPVLAATAAIASIGYVLFYCFAPSDTDPGGLLSALAFGVGSAVLLAPIFIAIFRFIILNNATRSYVLDVRSACFWRFCGWSIAFFLATGFTASLVGAYLEGDLGIALGLSSIVAAFFVLAVFVLVLPAVAVDAPDVTLRNAVADIRGSFWRVSAIQALTYFPFLAVIVVAYFAVSNEAFETSTVGMAIASFAVFCAELVWAAAAARVFLALADRLRANSVS